MGAFQLIQKYFKSSTVSQLQPFSRLTQLENCLCSLISPVLRISLMLGQNISCKSHVEYFETSPCPKDKIVRQSCIFQCNSRCLGSIVNWIFLSFYVYVTIWIYSNLGDHLGTFFTGTDLYTFGFEIISIYVQTTLLLLFARIRAPHLSKCLNHIQKMYVILISWNRSHNTKPAVDSPGTNTHFPKSCSLIRKLRRISYILVTFVSISSIIYACVFLYTIFGLTIPYVAERAGNNDDRFEKKDKAWREIIFILEKFAHILVPLQSQVFTIVFAVTALTIRAFYLQLGDGLTRILSPFSNQETHTAVSILMAFEAGPGGSEAGKRKQGQQGLSSTNSLALELERIRLIYEELGKGVEYLSQYFGLGLLTSCSISVLAITSGVYTIILEQTDISTPNDDQDSMKRVIRKYFYGTWAIHIYFALFSLLTILISGQNITNAASAPGKILKNVNQLEFDEQARHQVNLFLKSTDCPIHVTACRIIKIDLSFLAAAGTQLITYVLVLLQFRLDFTKPQSAK